MCAGACAWLAVVAVVCVECTHILSLDEDFSKLKTDPELAKRVEEVVRKLRTFKVSVHPRMRMMYRLLVRGMRDHGQRAAAELYVPHVYRPPSW